MWCTYCKKRIGWIEKLLIKCKIVHDCREKYVNRTYKYAIIPGFIKGKTGMLEYVSAQKLMADNKLSRDDCLCIMTSAQRAAYANIIKDLQVITP